MLMRFLDVNNKSIYVNTDHIILIQEHIHPQDDSLLPLTAIYIEHLGRYIVKGSMELIVSVLTTLQMNNDYIYALTWQTHHKEM